MLIQKIELENFTCYYGYNSFDFSEGLNIIIGDNGAGKSQLFDAFYWVLHDRVFMSKESRNFSEIKSKIISDRAIKEVENGSVKTSVKITVLDDRKNSTFILERKYEIHKQNDKIIKEPPESELIIQEKELTYLNAKPVTETLKRQSILNRILPENKSEYLWFQGEQVDKIIDFKQEASVLKAVNLLSNIDAYKKITDICNNLVLSAQAEYDRARRLYSKNANQTEELELEKKAIEESLKEEIREELRISRLLEEAEDKCDRIFGNMSDAENIRALQQEMVHIKNDLVEVSESYKGDFASFHRKMFSEGWVLKGTGDIFSEFNRLFEDYEKRKIELQNKISVEQALEKESMKILHARLPVDVPEPIYVRRMLEEEKCLVCDREAKKGSEPWVKIRELIDRGGSNTNPKVINPFKHDFSREMRNLYLEALVISREIPKVDEKISAAVKSLMTKEEKLLKKQEDLKNAQNRIDDLVGKTSLTVNAANGLLDEYYVTNRKIREYSGDLNIVRQKIENYRSKLNQVNDKLENMVKGEIPKHLTTNKTILSDLYEISVATRARVYENLILRLEEEANKHYNEMTAKNESVRGRIRLNRIRNGNIIPEITDSHGNVLHGLNTSNTTLVKLSVIMAIISANFIEHGGLMKKGLDGDSIDLYTFISDAPFSVFTASYTLGFCKTVSKVYRQSIIMSKEFYGNDALLHELLGENEIKLGKIFKIEPSELEHDRIDRSNLSTKIIRIN